MGVQPKHWLVSGRHVGQEGKLTANDGFQTCVVIAFTEEEAKDQGAIMLGLPANFITAQRFVSGAPVYDGRPDAE